MSEFHVDNISNIVENDLTKLKNTVNTILLDWRNLTAENEKLKQEIQTLKEALR